MQGKSRYYYCLSASITRRHKNKRPRGYTLELVRIKLKKQKNTANHFNFPFMQGKYEQITKVFQSFFREILKSITLSITLC